MSVEGVVNLAPFSFANLVASDPLCFMYCANGDHHEGGLKDSLVNARDTGEFVFNLCTWDLREHMNATSASPICLECQVVEIVSLPSSETLTNNMVIGRVVQVHVAEDAVVDGMIDAARLKPLGRLGYQDYSVVDASFSMVRPA